MFVGQRARIGTGALSLVTLAVVFLWAPVARARSYRATANDPRAVFVERNATRCAHLETDGVIDLPDDVVQLTGGGPDEDESAGDRYVTGTVTPNVQTPFGRAPRALQVAITPAGVRRGVVIGAVVVKGGNGYNAYVDSDFLPPALQRDQNYIPPWVGQNNIADISHWFVCYTLGPIHHHSLRVTKRVEPPVGVLVEPLPGEYRVHVTCTDNGTVVAERTFTFGAGGGSGTTETGGSEMTVPDGARCRVQERHADALPDGCEVRYEPQLANYPGVLVPDDGREVEVVNDCRDARVRTARLDIVKRIVGFDPGELPGSFGFDVRCTDGTDAEVTVPASGEPGTPRLDDIRVGEYCLVTERTGAMTPGLHVSYDINGSPSPVAGAAAFAVEDDRITVTVTNTASSSPPAPPPPEVPGALVPELDPRKTVQRALVRGGASVRYRIEVHGRGSGVARGVDVCDRLPRAMTLISAPGSRFRDGRICWRIGRLAPLGRRVFTLVAHADRSASGLTTNVVTADAPRAAVRTARAQVVVRPRRAPAPPAVTG